MRKNLTILIALLVAIAVAAPAMAAIEFKWGGQFRVRWTSANNIVDGTDNSPVPAWPDTDGEAGNDHSNFMDQRSRIYLTVQSSENLKFVTKLEMGDIVWGRGAGRNGPGSGGNVGADATNVELKNAYLDFAIPCTPSRAIVGIQDLAFLGTAVTGDGGWILDDDFSAAVVVTKLDPFKVTVGYVAGQDVQQGTDLVRSGRIVNSTWADNISDWFVAIDWACNPFKASLVWYYQQGHNVPVTFLPQSLNTPIDDVIPATTFSQIQNFYVFGTGAPVFDWFGNTLVATRENNFMDLGFNFTYQVEWLKAYVNFVKNFGSVKTLVEKDLFFAPDFQAGSNQFVNHDYTGWMVDAGLYYYCGPWTFNLSGFYTTGQKVKSDNDISTERGFNFQKYSTNDDINWFTYPLATTRYFSEIVGGGILDGAPVPGSFGNERYPGDGAAGTNYWRGYGYPTNLWTISAGAAWQVLPQTKLSLSYWYFGTAEQVMSSARIDAFGRMVGQNFSSSVGSEVDFYVTQGIIDGLTLDLVFAYLFTGDAYVNSWNGQWGGIGAALPAANFSKDDAFKAGARLQWDF